MTDSEDLERSLDRVARGETPRHAARSLSKEDRKALQAAQLIHGSVADGPTAEFVAGLRARLSPRDGHGIPRRTALLSGLGAMAAGVAAGFGIDHLVATDEHAAAPSYDNTPLVGENGRWMQVASEADMHEGAVRSFRAGAVTGFLVRRNGELKALSGVCTHMGCLLEFEAVKAGLLCPCHGAEFNLDGTLRRYDDWGKPISIPRLPELKVRVRQGAVEVWSA